MRTSSSSSFSAELSVLSTRLRNLRLRKSELRRRILRRSRRSSKAESSSSRFLNRALLGHLRKAVEEAKESKEENDLEDENAGEKELEALEVEEKDLVLDLRKLEAFALDKFAERICRQSRRTKAWPPVFWRMNSRAKEEEGTAESSIKEILLKVRNAAEDIRKLVNSQTFESS